MGGGGVIREGACAPAQVEIIFFFCRFSAAPLQSCTSTCPSLKPRPPLQSRLT